MMNWNDFEPNSRQKYFDLTKASVNDVRQFIFDFIGGCPHEGCESNSTATKRRHSDVIMEMEQENRTTKEGHLIIRAEDAEAIKDALDFYLEYKPIEHDSQWYTYIKFIRNRMHLFLLEKRRKAE